MSSYIWRYLDLAKFIHLMTSRVLHFTRVDQFKEKFEGSYPLLNLRDWQSIYPEVGNFKNWRKFACVSCWYESEYESAAMWELYGLNGQGLAICSTKKRLQDSLETDEVVFEKVKYIDFIRKKADIRIPLDAFKYKRIEFESENEFRAMLLDLPENDGFENGVPNFGSVDTQEGYLKQGKDISIDPEVLIEKVVFSPYAKEWYRETIERYISNCNMANISLVESDLAVDPVYPNN